MVTVKVPPHCVDVKLKTSNPRGKVSVNATPVKALFPMTVFEIVNLNVEVALFWIEVTSAIPAAFLNVLEMVGAGMGTAQPVNVMLSTNKSAPELSLFAPVAVIFTQTVLFCGILNEY